MTAHICTWMKLLMPSTGQQNVCLVIHRECPEGHCCIPARVKGIEIRGLFMLAGSGVSPVGGGYKGHSRGAGQGEGQ